MDSSSGRLGRDAALGFFAADVDFDQDVECLAEFGRGVVQPLREFGGVDGIDRVKNLGGFGCFVRLQMADHVELGVLQFGELRKLVGEFLHAVLAEEALSGRVGFDDRCGGKGLRYGHQCDVGGIAAGAAGRVGDAFTDLGELVGDAHGNPSLKQKARKLSVPRGLKSANDQEGSA